MMAMWSLSSNEWKTLQQRKLVDSSVAENKRLFMSFLQAVQLGVQMDLIRKVGLGYADALDLAREAAKEVNRVFFTSEEPVPPGTVVLFAFTKSGPKGKAAFMRIAPQMFQKEQYKITAKLGPAWAMLDVGHYLKHVLQEFEPERVAEHRT
jgi:hypothetical protein